MTVQYDPNAFSPFRTAIYLATAKYFFGTLFHLVNKLECSGKENIPDGPCIFVANHQSNWDPCVLGAAVERPVSFLAKQELYSDKFFKNLVRFYGTIPVDRNKPGPSTFKAVKEMLKANWCLGMFIEGTRSTIPGTLGQPHFGPAYFAKANKLPLVPVGILGTNIKYGKYKVKIDKPIAYQDNLEAVTWQIMEVLSNLTGLALPEKKISIRVVLT